MPSKRSRTIDKNVSICDSKQCGIEGLKNCVAVLSSSPPKVISRLRARATCVRALGDGSTTSHAGRCAEQSRHFETDRSPNGARTLRFTSHVQTLIV